MLGATTVQVRAITNEALVTAVAAALHTCMLIVSRAAESHKALHGMWNEHIKWHMTVLEVQKVICTIPLAFAGGSPLALPCTWAAPALTGSGAGGP